MKNTNTLAQKKPVLWLTMTAVFLAMNVALSSFGVPVPGGHLYLNDVVICTASILLDPFAAFVVGGIGAFLGDFFFYPTPMFVSLVTHGLQSVVISLCAHHLFKFLSCGLKGRIVAASSAFVRTNANFALQNACWEIPNPF